MRSKCTLTSARRASRLALAACLLALGRALRGVHRHLHAPALRGTAHALEQLVGVRLTLTVNAPVTLRPHQQRHLGMGALLIEQLEHIGLAVHHADDARIGTLRTQLDTIAQPRYPAETLALLQRFGASARWRGKWRLEVRAAAAIV
jgi:hypothetical protein